ncbi:hypothetical protein ACFX2I_036846 [Malus domestica]
MDKDKLLVMLFAIIVLLMPAALSATDPLSIFCSADGRSSQFESNLERLLSHCLLTLPSQEMFFQLIVYTGKYLDKDSQEKNVSIHTISVMYILAYLMTNVAAFRPSMHTFATGREG